MGSPLRSSLGMDAEVTGPPSRSRTVAGTAEAEACEMPLGRQGSDSLGDGLGLGLTSEEDLGWGGSDELEGSGDVDEAWQPDLSGYIAPQVRAWGLQGGAEGRE